MIFSNAAIAGCLDGTETYCTLNGKQGIKTCWGGRYGKCFVEPEKVSQPRSTAPSASIDYAAPAINLTSFNIRTDKSHLFLVKYHVTIGINILAPVELYEFRYKYAPLNVWMNSQKIRNTSGTGASAFTFSFKWAKPAISSVQAQFRTKIGNRWSNWSRSYNASIR